MVFIESVFLGILNSRTHGCSTGSATQNPLVLNQPSCHVQSGIVFTFVPFVHLTAIKHSGNEIVADSFHFIRTHFSVQRLRHRQNWANWVNSDYLYRFIMFFQFSAHSSYTPSCSNSHHNCVQLQNLTSLFLLLFCHIGRESLQLFHRSGIKGFQGYCINPEYENLGFLFTVSMPVLYDFRNHCKLLL